jgi:two-component system CheB/CheR fusion protein
MTESDGALEPLLEYLHRNRGFDFTGYKRSSLARRIQKRMQLVGIDHYAEYIDYLEVHPDEFSLLFNTILINVTTFFRDPEAWEYLQREVLPDLIASRSAEAPIRVWSAGCASGEEAYTLAMVFGELLGQEVACQRLKIYATDLDEEALRHARQASYSEADVQSVPAPLLEKYFEPAGGRFEFRRDMRRCVIFGRHDLIHDAPISRIDLLTCRNTIMYLNAETQSKILLRLHFALREGGVLFLGKAEMLLSHANLFTPLDLKARVFRRIEKETPSRERVMVKVPRAEDEPPHAIAEFLRLRESAFEKAALAQLVVDANGTVSLVNRRARELFGLSTRDVGRPLQDLEISYRPVELRSCIEQAYGEWRTITLKDVERTRGPGEPMYFDVQVDPLGDRGNGVLGAQVSFTDVTRTTRLHRELRQAHHELEAAYEELQSTGEELETTNEELQSTVEELETTNEELHSTNEELETMNEELQSTNEELQTLNDELRQRGEELTRVNAFMGTILSSLRAAVIVLDENLHVKVWNRMAAELWGLREEEVRGKNFMGLDIGLPVEKLRPLIRSCLAGEGDGAGLVEAVNRRGKAIRCAVHCAPLAGDGAARGIVFVIDDPDSAASRDVLT